MWEQLVVLARERRREAIETVADRYAPHILRRKIRDRAVMLAGGPRDVAFASGAQEARRRRAGSLRDHEEASRLTDRLEDAGTGRFPMDIDRAVPP